MGGTELADAWRSSIGAGGALSASELDVLFEVLADRERRRILRYFAESDDEAATFAELIEFLADEAAEGADPDRLAVTLHHTHLPKLADVGFIEYDDRSETVRYRGEPAVEEIVALARTYGSESDSSSARD